MVKQSETFNIFQYENITCEKNNLSEPKYAFAQKQYSYIKDKSFIWKFSISISLTYIFLLNFCHGCYGMSTQGVFRMLFLSNHPLSWVFVYQALSVATGDLQLNTVECIVCRHRWRTEADAALLKLLMLHLCRKCYYLSGPHNPPCYCTVFSNHQPDL